MSGPSNDDLAGAVVSTYSKLERAEAQIQELKNELRELKEGGERGEDSPEGEGGEKVTHVLTRDEYYGWSDDEKADFVDAHGIEGVQALMRGESVAVSKE